MSITNPGTNGESSSVSIPLGPVDKTSEDFFRRGVFPSTGVKSVRIFHDTKDTRRYGQIAIQRGADTQTDLYHFRNGRIFQVPRQGSRSQRYEELYG